MILKMPMDGHNVQLILQEFVPSLEGANVNGVYFCTWCRNHQFIILLMNNFNMWKSRKCLDITPLIQLISERLTK